MLVNNLCDVYLKYDDTSNGIFESYIDKPKYKAAFVVLLDNYIAVYTAAKFSNQKIILDSFESFKEKLENLRIPNMDLIPLTRVKHISTIEDDAFTMYNKVKNSRRLTGQI